MTDSPVLVEVWRGDYLECVHRGAAVVSDAAGEVVAAWGDAGRTVLPRSASKMLQALPLVESGAADAAGLTPEHLALACASHSGQPMHTERVTRWLAAIGRGEPDLRCGAHAPMDKTARRAMWKSGEKPCQIHNNCSGKHTGFLTLAKHLGAGPEYVDPEHPVQRAVHEAMREMTGADAPLGHAIDGCSAPNFAVTLRGLAAAMARMGAAEKALPSARARAASRLVDAMRTHPELVSGERRATAEFMRAATGGVAVKSGAEGVYVGILPARGLGFAVKIDDGAQRGSECAAAALLVRLGAADPADPRIAARLNPAQVNRRGIEVGRIAPAAELWRSGSPKI